MGKPHKHAELIKAWADGAMIEARFAPDGKWVYLPNPNWDAFFEYRIRPEPQPDITHYFRAGVGSVRVPEHWESPNLKLTFDGETLKLKDAEVLS
jgi:hypothetical protein